MSHHDNFPARPEYGPFRGPIDYADDAPDWAPTPLSPFDSKVKGAVPYMLAALLLLEDRVHVNAGMIGLPDDYVQQAIGELAEAMLVRADRNNRSFERLLKATDTHRVDDTMANIIDKARAGGADVSELLRLIKEHPEMISVEFFKRTTPFDPIEFGKAFGKLGALPVKLQREFKDSEIFVDISNRTMTAKPYITDHGALIRKYKLGEAKTSDSRIEIVMKQSDMILPHWLPIKNDSDFAITLNGSGHHILPLGLSAYFRVADYKNRIGYESPDDEHCLVVSEDFQRALGRRAANKADEITAHLPKAMIGVYYSAVNRVEKPSGHQ